MQAMKAIFSRTALEKVAEPTAFKLRLIQVPIAFTRSPSGSGRLQCHYMYYPLPVSSGQPDPLIKRSLGRLVNVWKSGLWVVGRMYRSVGNLTFYNGGNYRYPPLPRHSRPELSMVQRARKRVFDYSDALIWRWAPCSEEDLMRNTNTKAEFIHLHEKMSMPLKKAELVVPSQLLELADKDQLEFCSPFTYPSPQNPHHDQEYVLKGGTSDCKQVFIKHLQHLSYLSENRFKKLNITSRVVLLVTVPFYAVWANGLPYFDSVLTTAWLHGAETLLNPELLVPADEAYQILRPLKSWMSLPLAYNMIKIFSYQRCVAVGSFFKKLLALELVSRPKLDQDLQKLIAMYESKNSEGPENVDMKRQKEVLDALHENVKATQRAVDDIGVDVTTDSHQFAHISDMMAHIQITDNEPVYLSQTAISTLARHYGVPPAQMYKDIFKAQQKLRIRFRLLSNQEQP